ncbi:hypothetical protein L1049_017048 [Liquidambar formosana]|uniref:INO80 complex subunit B-like conserved region domain-containing protein n=1 Tax=Liquidambar formosana TaxID=63359 RepID=A0AAP0S7J0_LIQFO
MDSSYSCHPDKGKEYSRSGSCFGKEYSLMGKMSRESFSLNESYQYEPVRKSKRVPKRRILDVGPNDDDEDEEIRYLGRLNASKVAADYEDEEEESRKKQGVLKSSQMNDMMHVDDMEGYRSPRVGKDRRKKLRSEKMYDEEDYMEEEEPTSDYELDAKRKKSRKESLDYFIEERKDLALVTRKRALQSSKDVLSDSGATLIDLPNGLPFAPSKMEQQLKKAEAAQRRRMQSEKAAREAEAGAIRKILGQDSGRKKREDKMKQQRDELAQRKADNNVSLALNTVRWVLGPTGTVVTFSEDIGLPNIFNPVPCSYPPPREKCVGPNCTNAYKYRDSKSKLPLCSLNCYKAIHGKMQPLITC